MFKNVFGILSNIKNFIKRTARNLRPGNLRFLRGILKCDLNLIVR